MQRKIFYLLLLLAILPVLLTAGTRGKIKGKVVDLQTGEPLIGANVYVVGTQSGANSDANGDYIIHNLEAGVYTLRAAYVGYQTITLSGVRVNADLTSYVNFELPSEDIQVGTVEIVAQKPLVQRDNTNAVRITTAEDIEALPIRGVSSIIQLTAGVATYGNDIVIRGGRPDEVGFYLDGVSIKSPIGAGAIVTLNQDILEEIQVQSGGYAAEFGNSNAGIIRQQMRSGTDKYKLSYEYITDNVTLKSGKNAFDGEKRLGAHWWGYNEQSFSASGPVPFANDIAKFFFNFNYGFNRGAANWNEPINVGWIKDPVSLDSFYLVHPGGPFKGLESNRYSYAGTVSLDLKPFIVKLTGNYSWRPGTNGGQRSLATLAQTRRGTVNNWDGVYTAKITHVINSNLYYELNAGYLSYGSETYDQALGKDPWVYGDSVMNAQAGWVWTRSKADLNTFSTGKFTKEDSRYYFQRGINVWNLGFTREGSLPGGNNFGVSWNNRTGITLAGNMVYMIGKVHTIKLGGSYEQYTIRNWNAVGVADLASKLYTFKKQRPTANVDSFKVANQINTGVANFGYDVLGNEYDGDGLYEAMKPVTASAYIQDKLEYEDIILNVGLRFDYYDTDGWELVDPTKPELGINFADGTLNEKGWQKSPTFKSISPRLGFAFPVTDKTVFHAEWGKFVQMPALNQMYTGLHDYAYDLRGGFFISNPTALGFRPTRTTQYELGFSQQLGDNFSFSVSGYYRDIKDQLNYRIIKVDKNSPFSDYASFTNGDFATTKGLELTFNMRRYKNVLVSANLAFQDARGTGSNPSSNAGIVGSPLDGVTVFTPQYISPLQFDYPMRGNMNVDYRFGNETEVPSYLRMFGVSALVRFSSGHPYTLGTGGLNASTDARFRQPLEALNTSLTPNQLYFDLRVDKTFQIMNKLSANVYVFVMNLFDIKNELDVHLKTGTASDNGDIYNPDMVSKNIANYGSLYRDAELAIYQYNNYGQYSGPRQIRLGLRFEFN
ncbi:MAG: TonB-dependent receptor [Ignavibacteria bacterium]|nr:MAG: TonB-dependent receptor [Ignavibacteria bacterium]KAF0161210.1 MAG: TonB-dependent receptor [Ignavibacteria bacterium]